MLQKVVLQHAQGTVFAEARVQGHTEAEEEGAELRVGECREVAVVVEGEVLHKQGGHEPRAQRVNAEGHGSGERVPNLLLHDLGEAIRVGAEVQGRAVFVGHEREDVVVHGSSADRARVDEVRDHLTPEEAVLLCEMHDDARPVGPEMRQLDGSAV